MNAEIDAKPQNNLIHKAAIVIGIYICLNFLPLSLLAIMFIVGVVPSAALIYLIVFYVRAWKKTAHNQPFTKIEYTLFVVISIIGLAVAIFLMGALIIGNSDFIFSYPKMTDLILPLFTAISYPVAAIFSLVIMMRFQKQALRSVALPTPAVTVEPSQATVSASTDQVRAPQGSSQPPVPTQPQPVPHSQAPQNPAPPSDKPKPQS